MTTKLKIGTSIQHRHLVRTIGMVTCVLGIVTLVSWYIPHYNLQSCMRGMMEDCSITQDNTVNNTLDSIASIGLLLTIISASVAMTIYVVDWVRPVSPHKIMAWYSFTALIASIVFAISLRLLQTRWPGNTINWRYDQMMSGLFFHILLISMLLFIVSLSAVITCGFLIYRPRRLAVFRMIEGLVVLIVVAWCLANR